MVSRPVPLHAAEKTWATMHAFHRRRRVDIFARGDWHLIELIVAVAVEQSEQTILAAHCDDGVRLAGYGRLEQGTDLAQIGIMHVVGNELAIPQELASLGVERNQRV